MKVAAQFQKQDPQHGGAGVKMLVFLAVVALIANAGYNFIPIAYQGESFKQDMYTAVVQGVSLPSTYGKPLDIVRFKVIQAAQSNQLPYDAVIDVKQKGNVVTARVYFVKDIPVIPFGVYDYHYVFDYTVTPDDFMNQ